MKIRIIRKVMLGPLRRVGGIFANIIAFNIAMTLYGRLRRKLKQGKSEKEEEDIFIRPTKNGGERM